MNSPFWSLVMRYFLEFFSMVPCAVLCFLPVQDRLRQKPLNIFLTGIPLSILWAFAGGLCSFSRKMQNIFASFAKNYFKNRKRTF